METLASRNGHLASQELAAYVDKSLTAEERTAAEAHLAECAECRREVLEVTRVLRSRYRIRPYVAGGLAAAAAVATLLLVNPRPGREESVGSERVVRSSGRGVTGESSIGISVISPQDGSEISSKILSFHWKSLGTDVLYRVILTDQNGADVWTIDTPDTGLTLPASIALMPGRRYFWYVDALLPDGQTATTGVHGFTVKP